MQGQGAFGKVAGSAYIYNILVVLTYITIKCYFVKYLLLLDNIV